MTKSRTIRVKALTRVEGEGALHVRLRGKEIETVELNIYEPPRFFEALLRGRPLEDAPDITARICGICPVAYQMSSVHAMERALGIQITPEIRTLRRLLYCGEWIESHALHMHMLHAPDFHNVASGLELAERFPNEVKRGLKLKKIGNQLLAVLGGRSVHPINVCVGGFYRPPRMQKLKELVADFEWGLQSAIEAVHWVNTFPFPDLEYDYDLVALTHPDEYPFNEGTMRSSLHGNFDVDQYEAVIEEYQVAHSTAMQARNSSSKRSCLFGPLARLHLNREQLNPQAQRLAEHYLPEQPCRNPFKGIIARGIEVVHAFEEAMNILKNWKPPSSLRVNYEYCRGEGAAATEAPRGTLFHRYQVNESGQIETATIIAPTSQNQKQIEIDLERYLPPLIEQDDDSISQECEKLIRSYDPCISCATHFLNLTIERSDEPN